MTQYRCESRSCNMPGIHQPDADPDDCGPDCRGCGPAVAADGLRLCRVCARRIGHDAWRCAWLYAALTQALTGGQATDGGALGSVSREPGLSLRETAVEARDAIRAMLVSLVRMIAEERGISLPARREIRIERLPAGFIGPARRLVVVRGENTAQAFAAYIGRHAVWLAAHPAAGEHAEQLRDVALDPRIVALAFPGGRAARLLIGACPLPALTDPHRACGTPVYAVRGEALVVCRGCRYADSIDAWYRLLVGDLPPPAGPVSAFEGAWRLSRLWGRAVTTEAVRKWGQRSARTGVAPVRWVSLRRGEPGPLMRDEAGRTLYQWAELVAYAERQWGALDPPAQEEDEAA